MSYGCLWLFWFVSRSILWSLYCAQLWSPMTNLPMAFLKRRSWEVASPEKPTLPGITHNLLMRVLLLTWRLSHMKDYPTTFHQRNLTKNDPNPVAATFQAARLVTLPHHNRVHRNWHPETKTQDSSRSSRSRVTSEQGSSLSRTDGTSFSKKPRIHHLQDLGESDSPNFWI